MTDGDGTGADFDVADGAFTGTDAGEPVADVIVAFVELDLVFLEVGFDEGLGGGFEFAAVDEDAAVGADEGDAVTGDVFDDGAVGVDELGAAFGIGLGRGEDFEGAAFVHAEAPLGDVEVVGAPVGDHATAVFAEGAPVGEVGMDAAGAEHGVVFAPGGGAEPEVPVEAGFGGFGGEVAPAAGAADADVNFLDLAEGAIADQLAGSTEFAGGALHGAGLEDATVFAYGIDQGSGFVDGLGEGFFAVDILASFGGENADEGVPMVGGGHDDGVDVGPGQEVAEVGVGGADLGAVGSAFLGVVLFDGIAGVVPALGIDVADGDDGHVGAVETVSEEVSALGTVADEAEVDFLGGRHLGAPDAGREERGGHGHGSGGGGSAEERTA